MHFLISKYSMFAADFGGHCVLLDTGCNSPVVAKTNCITRIRRNKQKQWSNTLAGAYTAPYTAESIPFGDVYYDPNIPFSVLSYYIVAERGYVKPSRDGLKFTADFPTYVDDQYIEITFTFIEGMLMGDGRKLINYYDKCAAI